MPARSPTTGPAACLLAVCAAAGPVALRADPPKPDACVECHREQDEKALIDPVRLMENDVHRAAGFSCADCHGGDPAVPEDANPYTESKDKAKGYRGSPDRRDVAALCARCHSDIQFMRKYNPRIRVDQHMEYLTSRHGELVGKGDRKAATCTSCHGAHGIRKVKDPAAPVYPVNVPALCARCHADPETMKEYEVGTRQVESYLHSQHGVRLLKERDTGAPSCGTCHGNHGAAPPGTASVAHVCGNCHGVQAEDFEQSAHAAHFALRKLPLCASCHDPHATPKPGDHLLTDAPGGVCNTCHQKGDPCYLATGRMLEAIRSFAQARDEAAREIDRAERLGMSVSQAKFDLAEVEDSLTKARVKIHRFHEADVTDTLRPGLATIERVRERAREALEEHAFRRKGLAVSAALILLTVGLLVLKIRRIERTPRGGG